MMRVHILTKKRQSGFTLIELIVAVVILSILAAIAIPGFSRWLPGYRLKSAARDVFSNLQLAKLEAIKQNQDCAINFTTTGGDQYTVPLLNKTVVLADYASGVKFEGPGAETFDASPLTFNSRGLCPDNGNDWVYLSNAKNSAYYRVGLPSVAGVVKLEKWQGGTWQ